MFDNRICSCIGLHDFAYLTIKWKDWFEYVVQFLNNLGLQPTKMQLNGNLHKGMPYGNSTHVMSFKGGKKKLEQYEFKNIENMALICLDKGEKTVANFIASVSIYPDFEYPIGSKIILCVDSQLLPYNNEILQNIALSLQELTKAKYGYYYQRHLKNAPDCYVVGGGTGWIDKEDKHQLQKWSDVFSRGWKEEIRLDPIYRTGRLRDIYLLNFLSREHLDWPLLASTQNKLSHSQSQTLSHWINSNSENGTLTKLSSIFWCWEVQEDKIEYVRLNLLPSGIIIGV